MLKVSCAGYLGLSLAISAQFALKMCIAARNHEKFTKTPNFGVQGRSKMLMKLKSS